MRLKGKKPIFNFEDTYSLDETLRPIIGEGLKKFKEVLEKRDSEGLSFGVPSEFCVHENDEKLEKAKKAYFEVLDKMVYAFTVEEPEYTGGFYYGEDHGEEVEHEEFGVVYKFSMKPNDPVAHKQHTEDLKAHAQKCQEGLELFGKYYKSLWW